MPAIKLSACIEMIFNDTPDFCDRIDRAAETGLSGFEFWGWRNKDLAAIKQRAAKCGIPLACFSLDAKGPMVDPDNTASWIESAKEGIARAVEMGCPTLIATTGNELEIPREQQHAAIVACFKGIAPVAQDAGITLVLEPLNIAVDHGGYYLSTSDEGFEILNEVDSPAIRLLYDIYHQQVTEGNLIQTITQNVGLIGHFHMADVPGRHQPGTGEINYTNVFSAIAATDYAGFVGMEFAPVGSHTEAVKATQACTGE